MKAQLHNIYTLRKSGKIFHWSKLLTVTGGAQAVIQAVGLLGGILIIRFLPTAEYAYYTLANTILGTITILGDGGISAGVMSLGGKVWSDKEKLGVVLATGLLLKRKFAFGSLLVTIPVLTVLLHYHGAGWISIVLIVLSLIPAIFAALSDSLLEIIPKLQQDILPLQKNQVTVAFLRLFVTSLSIIFLPFTFIAILTSGISRLYGNIGLFKIAKNYADYSIKADTVIQKEILTLVKKILPVSIYYCLSGQITIWLISIFGNTSTVAQAGALSRISMILLIFNTLLNTLIVPRFSRLPDARKLLLKRFVQLHVLVTALFVLIVLMVKMLPSQILWILGKGYENLQPELILSMIAGAVVVLSAMSYSLCISRGKIINPYIAIPVNITTVIVCIVFIDISVLRGIILLSLITASVQLVMNFGYGFVQFSGLTIKKSKT